MKKLAGLLLVLALFDKAVFAVRIPLGEPACKSASPIAGCASAPLVGDINGEFGDPRTSGPHGGQDRLVPGGTPVHPIGEGTIIGVRKDVNQGKLGCWVAVKHSDTAYTIYGHLDCAQILVSTGAFVTFNTILALSGDSGFFDAANTQPVGAHLHWEEWTGYPSKLNDMDGMRGVALMQPLPSSGFGRPINPRCACAEKRPEPPEPPALPPTPVDVQAWTAHDPNAMLGPEGYVTPGQVMTYTVMFENEGLGTAFDVYVTDTFDSKLDDSNIVIKDFYLVDWATNIETPVTLPYSYDPQSHKLTVLAGTFESRQGGKFTVELRLKPDVPQGTVVKNFATVYFPTALEETRTNSIISAVPQPASVAYTGSTVAVYSSYAMIAATVTNSGQTLLGKTVNFYIGGSTLTALTGGTGEASVYAQVDAPPGDYELTAAFPGDGYYYTSSTQVVTLQIRKSETYIADFSTVTYSTTPVITVAMTNNKGVQILHQDTAPQKIHLEYQDGGTWVPLGEETLSSGTAVFQFPLPQTTTTTYHLQAKYNGNDYYFPTESTATLTFVDITPPTVELAVNGVPLEAGATGYISDMDPITITAEDFGAGPKNILYTLDVAFSTPAATAYTGPFTLPAGAHTIYYTAVDNVGNMAPVKDVNVVIQPAGDMMPTGYTRKIAGTGIGGYSGDGGDALLAQFNSPLSLTADGHGNILIADTYNHVIRKVTAEGKVFTIAGNGTRGFSGDGGPAINASFNLPNDIVVDSQGNIFITDRNNKRVRKIDALTGNITTVAQISTYADGIGIDNADNLYISESYCTIYKLLPDGQKQRVAGVGVNGFSGDGGAAVNAQISTRGGLTFDTANNLYIADTYNHRVRKVDAAGIITTVAGGGTLTDGDVPALQRSFYLVNDVGVDLDGNLFILGEFALYRLSKETGYVETVLGQSEAYLPLTSTPMPASFAYVPYNRRLFLDAANVIYFLPGGIVGKVSLPGIAGSSDGSMKLYSTLKDISISTIPAESPEAAAFLAAASQKGLLSAGPVYFISPSGEALSPSGSAVLKYDPQVVVDTNTLAIFTYDGVLLSSSPDVSGVSGQQLLPTRNLIAAEVQRIPSLLGLLVYVADNIPPRSELIVGAPTFGSAPVFVSTKTVFTLTSSDDLYIAGDKKGFGVGHSAVSIKQGGGLSRELVFNNPAPSPGQIFVSTFSLDLDSSGVYAIEYYAADLSGNIEPAKAATVHLDTAAPTAELVLEGPVEPTADGFNSVLGFNIRIVSTDSISGVGTAKYLVDVSTDICNWALPAVSTEPAGTCRNPVYAGPFALPIGTHTIYYSAVDNVGNQAPVKSVFVNIERSKYPDVAQWPYFEYFGRFGAYGTGPGYFTLLRGLNFDSSGNVWAADPGKIEIFTPGGEYLRTFTAGLASLTRFSICPDGTFWALAQVANGYSHALKKFSGDGALVREIDISGSPQFDYAYPRFVVCDKGNMPFVAAGPKVLSFETDGSYKGEFPLSGYYEGLASDAAGNILILAYDYAGNNLVFTLKRFSQAGSLLASIPLISSSAASVSLDAYDNIYIANYSYSSVDIYTSSGGLIGTFGALPVGRQMMPLGQPHYVGVHPYSGKLYVGGNSDIKIYGPDHTPPQLPEILTPVSNSTVMTDQPFVYGTGESGAHIAILDGGSQILESTVGNDGYFSGNLVLPGYGTHHINAVAMDAAGNTSALTPPINITRKNLMPVVFSPPQYGPVSFDIWDTSATVTADFNKDGMPDVVAFAYGYSYYYGNYAFYAGRGNGSFDHVYSKILGSSLGAADDAFAADFNGDGNLDIAMSVRDLVNNTSRIGVLLGNGAGTFSEPTTYGFINRYAELTPLDFNKDNKVDIASNFGDNVVIYTNGGTGEFSLAISTPPPAGTAGAGGWTGGIKAADLDLDGNTDIVARNSVLFGNGSGGFSESITLQLLGANNAAEVEVADLNKDGYPEIIICSISHKVITYLNLRNRSFIVSSVNTAPYPSSADIGDFNGDDALDIAISPVYLQNLTLLLGKGDGTFSEAVNYPTGVMETWPSQDPIGTINATDINNDTLPDVVMAASLAKKMDGSYVKSFISFLNMTPVPDNTAPSAVSLVAAADESGDVVLNWTAPGDDGNVGRAFSYDLRTSLLPIANEADFAAANQVGGVPTPKTAGLAEEFRVSGLAGGNTYYLALRSADEFGNISGLSNSPGAFLNFVAKSTTTIDGNPEIILSAYQQMTVTPADATSTAGVIALGTAAVQGLFLVSNLYDLGPEGSYEPPAMLTFYYSPAALGGIPESELAVYEHFPEEGWVRLEGQTLDVVDHKITVPISRIASLFGIFWKARDTEAPQTRLLVSDGSWLDEVGKTYISGKSSITLEAYDPVVYGTSTGVAFTGSVGNIMPVIATRSGDSPPSARQKFA
ncbi:MAG: FG-GAP-like repeat-containing protein [Elusimicrobiota bacterium]|nr:FG-GAP-like repeat-containing protein [Elusimicrobiota bacterium]